jgi:small ligand-binding sensory domain FIST
MLEFYSSSNRVVNSKRAVAECLENALGTDDLDCDLIIFYTTVGHAFEEILSELHRLSPNAQIVGCIGMGIIGREGPSESLRGLGIMAIRGPREEYAIASIDSIGKADRYDIGARIAQDLKDNNAQINMILFLPAALDIMPVDRAIEGIESVFGTKVPIFGSLSVAGSSKGFCSFQFMGDRIIEGGAVAVGFADPTLEVIMGADHGFRVFGEPFEVTRSEGNRIFELDGKAAWKALTEWAGLPETVDPFKAVHLDAIARPLPEELHEEYGSPYSLFVGGSLKGADGSLMAYTVCPVGTKLWPTQRDEENIFKGVDRIVDRIVNKSGGRRPVAVFHADCSARGKLTFHRVLKEELISRMQYPLCRDENVPWLGHYGAGELARIGGLNRIHGYTTSLFVLYRREG